MSTATEATSATTMPVSAPYRNTNVTDTIQLPNRVFGRFKQSERQPINDAGYLFSILERSNPQIGGGMNAGDVMLTGGSDSYVTLMVLAVVTNGARAWGGGAIRQMSDGKYYGMSQSQQEVLDANRFATEHDKDICFSGRTKSRGVVSGISSYDSGANETTITFSSTKNGSYYLREMEGRKFLFHHPTTFQVHGGTTPFELKRVPDGGLTAVFAGDLTGGTAIAANDIIVPIGTADNKSSVNKGLASLANMTPVSGEYFTVNVANHDKVKGFQYDLTGNDVTRAVLQYMDTVYMLRYPNDPIGTKNHTDIFGPTQKARMLFEIESYLRINSTDGAVAYNPMTAFKGWNGREMLEDVFILPTSWHVFFFGKAKRGVMKEFGVWDYDNQTERAIPSSGSIRDAKQKHWIAVDSVWHEDPRKNQVMINASTTGAPTAVNI